MRSTAVLVSAMLSVGAGIPAGAAPLGACDGSETPSPSEPVQLCGVTTITASAASVARVVIPQEVTIRSKFGPGLDIEIAGEAPLAGFVLADDAWEHVLLAGVMPKITAFPDLRVFRAWRSDGASGSERFAPGEYRLYVLADGSPVSVTLRLAGLSGEARLTPSTPADYRGGFLPPRYSIPTGHYYSADRAEELRAGGLGYHLAWIETKGPGHLRAGVCRSNVEQEHGWLECGGWGTVSLGERRAVMEDSAELFRPSDWESWHLGGVAYSTAPEVVRVGVLAVWLGRAASG